ncbi:DUF4123 domain-containing protein [Acidovorax cavernicola]|uniref:DUF4123 domain-containing protein n=1 Tax=Acidovorax cavernicola TaxID=1675792 RepID=A0A9X8D3T0_9BURK|nr:DUF4123 domain-containing protein [Acidovorax cavernicola]RIX78341.1 DUF4123 domain-containing protein [Acidovorax cavernicola]
MEFATDPIDPVRLAHAVQAMADTSPSLGLWLLVDAALLDPARLASVLRLNGWSHVNALANTPLEAYGARGPQLLELPRDDEARAEGLQRLATIDPAAPAFSWLASGHSVADLQSCFGYLAQARHDGLKLHCRMGDARVLPTLLATLSEPQTRRVAQAIVQWQWVDRSGVEVGHWLAADAEEGTADASDHLELDAPQFAALLDASEADGIFAQLLETVSQLVPKTDRAAFHLRLQRALEAATRLHVAGNPDRLQFVVLSLTCGDDFYQHPDLSDTWKAVAQGTSLSSLMKGWSDDLWKALEGKAS